MVRQKAGNIINISSIMGLGPFPGAIANAAAKAGVISLTRTSALEWAPYNIRVNAIAPGFIETAIMTKAWNEHPSMMQEDLQYIPLGRMGKPEDIAGAAIFLASPASAYITGETIVVNGGLITTFSPGFARILKEERK